MTRDGPETPGAGDRCTVEEQRWRWERKRECTARELLQTERIYVDELELITKFYDEVFRARCDHLKISDRGICGAIPEIVKVHRVLLSHLEAGSASLGFEALSQSLCLYKRHADSIEPTLLILETKSKKNKSFARFKKLQESRPELHGRCLEQLLQLPLQRVTQYKHFLRDLMENSLPRSRDTSRLSHAFAVVCDVCQHMENISNHQENYRQLQRVQKMLKGRTLCVLTQGRWYIREGWLSLVPQSGEEVKHRMLFLFSDIIAVTSQCHPLHPTSAHKFACRAVYPLKECRVERILGHTQSQGGLLSVSFENEKVMLMSSDQEDINDWYNCLVTAVRKAQPHCEHQEKNRTEQKAQKRTRGLELRDIPSTVKSLSSHDVSPKRVKISAERPPVSPSPASPPTHSAGWSCVLL